MPDNKFLRGESLLGGGSNDNAAASASNTATLNANRATPRNDNDGSLRQKQVRRRKKARLDREILPEIRSLNEKLQNILLELHFKGAETNGSIELFLFSSHRNFARSAFRQTHRGFLKIQSAKNKGSETGQVLRNFFPFFYSTPVDLKGDAHIAELVLLCKQRRQTENHLRISCPPSSSISQFIFAQLAPCFAFRGKVIFSNALKMALSIQSGFKKTGKLVAPKMATFSFSLSASTLERNRRLK